MPEVEQRMERLPSDRDGAARIAAARRNAWVLGGVALAFYLGYMLWFVIRGSLG
jgi:hypothetical protein